MPDRIHFEDPDFTSAVRWTVQNGIITSRYPNDPDFTAEFREMVRIGIIAEETLKKITTLTLNHLPEDLSLLEQYFPNLQKIRLPESEAKNALSTLNGAYAVVVLPKGVDLP